MFFVQTSTPPPRMHQKLTKHEKFDKQNNQLPTESHVELKNNSVMARKTSCAMWNKILTDLPLD
jgi:hypothetical protein